MIDPKILRTDPDAVRRSQAIRGESVDLVDDLIAADERRRSLMSSAETARAEQKSLSARIPKSSGEEKTALLARTKELAAQLQAQEIAVIAHEDLDAVGAAGLVEAGAAAVINAHSSLTCRYPNLGPRLLHAHGIPLLDNVGEEIFSLLADGDEVEIEGRKILKDGQVIAVGTVVTAHMIEERERIAQLNLPRELERFVSNTLEYAAREKDTGLIHSRDLVKSISQTGQICTYMETFEQVADYLRKNTSPGDIVITMGAGDIYKVGDMLLDSAS